MYLRVWHVMNQNNYIFMEVCVSNLISQASDCVCVCFFLCYEFNCQILMLID